MIIYFSGTGNTKYCAQKIAKELNEKIVSININLKNEIYKIDMKGENTLGILAPTYDYDLAWIVKEYLEKVEFKNISKTIYSFGIFTCGGDSSGICAQTLDGILNKKDLKLDFNTTIPMPDNYILLYKLDTSKNVEKMKNADILIDNVIENLKEKRSNKIKTNFGAKILANASKLIVKSQKDTKTFEVNDDCISCGLCSKTCPLNIITMENNKPVWKDKDCSCCLSCINRCPKRAISKGKMSIKNEHYFNENVDADI